MRIEKFSNVSYKAKFLNKAEVKKLIKGSYPCSERKNVNFIKIESLNTDDIKALSNAAKYWQDSKFSTNIYYVACALRNESQYYKNHELYALTEQETDFEKPDSDKLLGLVHVSPNDDGYTLIEHIEVNPKYLYIKEPEYRGLGTAMLNSIKQIYDRISCYPLSARSVINFYEKNGFVKQPENYKYYTFSKK